MNKDSQTMLPYVLLWCMMSITIGCAPKEDKESYLFVSDGTVDETLSRISKSRIKKLQIEHVTLSDEEMAIIGSFKNLELLGLERCAVDVAGFRHLANLRNLKDLGITLSHITDAGLIHVAELNNLQRLRLGGNEITDAGLIHLAELQNLKELRLSSRQITGRGFESLTGLKSLRFLDLSGRAIDDSAMKHVAHIKELQTLWLYRTGVTDAGLMHLTGNYWLLSIVPSEHMTVEGMRKFRKTLLEGRRQARARGENVPPDDRLFIQTHLDPEARGPLPPHMTGRIQEEQQQQDKQ